MSQNDLFDKKRVAFDRRLKYELRNEGVKVKWCNISRMKVNKDEPDAIQIQVLLHV